jgi:LmbE family N-acetylglucosaminyl deacetylase
MKTLVVAAHLDDEAISCGGLIARRADAGCEVTVAFVFDRFYPGRPESRAALFKQECADMMHAKSKLRYQEDVVYGMPEGEPTSISYYDILVKIESLMKRFEPDEIIVHGSEDRNQDHKFLGDIMAIALRPSNLRGIKRVIKMLPMDGGGSKTRPNYFVPLTLAQLNRKLSAVACYREESRLVPHPRCLENIEAYARIMGSACGHEFAEGYQLDLQIE